MPRPPHLCTCGRIVPHGTTCECQVALRRARNARHDARRPSARQRGYSRAWEEARADYLKHHPDCVMCGQPATVVDHVTPHRGNAKLFWDRSNWQSLCTHHHNSAKQRQEREASQ